MLKITGDGRRAALDLRLVGHRPDPTGGKIGAAADRIAAIHALTHDNRYLDVDGQPHQRPGALQLVFCDVSTPSRDGWNAYEELRSLLVQRGVPANGIRFVHEAATDHAKANLFAACRDGRVAVLIGSTEKMGVGTNVQARAIALHHLDCPWRPADIEQREGRILRQGNQNDTVSIHRYAIEGSFDIYMWQTVERKAAFINQVATGRALDRDVDDIGDQALSYAEVKALATGDPLILEKASVDADVARLTRLRRAHLDDQHRMRRTLDAAERRVAAARSHVRRLETAITRRTDTRGDRFSMTIGEASHPKRADAGAHLQRILDPRSRNGGRDGTESAVARLAGFDVHAGVDVGPDHSVWLAVPEAGIELRYAADEWEALDPAGIVQRLERRVQNLDAALADIRQSLDEASNEAERARQRIGAPFEHEDELQHLQRRQREIDDHLLQAATSPPVEPPEQRMAARLASQIERVPAAAPPTR